MRRTWILAMAAGVTMSAAIPMQANAQGRSAVAQERRNQKQDQRERERERLRVERDGQVVRERETDRDQVQGRREAEQRNAELRRRQVEQEREAQQRAAELRRRQQELQREQQARMAEQRRRELERERLRDTRDGRYDDDRYYERRDDRYGYDPFPEYGKRNQGPAFCRSGQGHPVHGRQWCVQKGFGLGWDRWERDRYDDVIFRDRYYRNQTFGRSMLSELLGAVLVNRFESYGRRYGSGPLTGYWVPNTSQRILQLALGNVPIARLVDVNRDGRVDDLFVIR